MAYTKNTWNVGDVITKAKLDNIEQGIYDAHDGAENIDRIPEVWKAIMRSTILAEAQRYEFEDVFIDSFIDQSGISSLGGWNYDSTNKKITADFMDGVVDFASSTGGTYLYCDPLRFSGQVYNVGHTGYITKVVAHEIGKDGTGGGNITCEIRTVSGGLPTTTILDSVTILSANVVVGGQNIFYFDTPITVTAGQQICVIFKGSAGDSSNYWSIKSPSGSGRVFTSNGGSSWGVDNSNKVGASVYVVPTGSTLTLETTAETLSATKTQVLINSLNDTASSITLTYDVSLDNGAHWQTVAPDTVTNITYTGSFFKMRIKAVFDNITLAKISVYGYGIAIGG